MMFLPFDNMYQMRKGANMEIIVIHEDPIIC